MIEYLRNWWGYPYLDKAIFLPSKIKLVQFFMKFLLKNGNFHQEKNEPFQKNFRRVDYACDWVHVSYSKHIFILFFMLNRDEPRWRGRLVPRYEWLSPRQIPGGRTFENNRINSFKVKIANLGLSIFSKHNLTSFRNYKHILTSIS